MLCGKSNTLQICMFLFDIIWKARSPDPARMNSLASQKIFYPSFDEYSKENSPSNA